MAVIKVPKPPSGAFNKNRPVSALLRNQILHLQQAELRLPIRRQTDIYINKIKTEGEAAEYIERVTRELHPEGARSFEIAAMGERKIDGKAKAKTKRKREGNAKPKRKKL